MKDFVEKRVHYLVEASRTKIQELERHPLAKKIRAAAASLLEVPKTKLQELRQTQLAKRTQSLVLRFGFVVPLGLGIGFLQASSEEITREVNQSLPVFQLVNKGTQSSSTLMQDLVFFDRVQEARRKYTSYLEQQDRVRRLTGWGELALGLAWGATSGALAWRRKYWDPNVNPATPADPEKHIKKDRKLSNGESPEFNIPISTKLHPDVDQLLRNQLGIDLQEPGVDK